MRRKRARSVEVFAQPGAPPGFKIRAGSGAVAGQITDAQGGEEPGRDFQRKAGDGKSERTQFDGVLGGADNGQAQGFKAGFLPGKVVMIGEGQHAFRAFAEKGGNRVQGLGRIADAAGKDVGAGHGGRIGKRRGVCVQGTQTRGLHAEGEDRPGILLEALFQRRNKFRPLFRFGLDEIGSGVAQAGFRFAPASRGNDAVPVGGGAARSGGEAHVVLVEEHEIEVAPRGEVLKAVVEQVEVGREFGFRAGSRAVAVGIDHDHGVGMARGQHERFVAAFGGGHAGGRPQGQRRGMRAVAAREHGGAKAVTRGVIEQPVRDRSFARAAPGNISHGRAGPGRLPLAEQPAARHAAAEAAPEAVEQGEGQQNRRENVLQGVAFCHGGTGRKDVQAQTDSVGRHPSVCGLFVPDGRVVDDGLFIRAFQLEDDGAQTVVAAYDGHARRFDPVAVVEEFVTRAVRQREHVLRDGLPSFVAEVRGLGVVGVKDLAGFEHGAGAESFDAVFFGKGFVEGRFQNGDAHALHVEIPVAVENRWITCEWPAKSRPERKRRGRPRLNVEAFHKRQLLRLPRRRSSMRNMLMKSRYRVSAPSSAPRRMARLSSTGALSPIMRSFCVS